MRLPLKLHPDSPPPGVQVEVDVGVTKARTRSLMFSYVLTGNVADIVLPSVVASERMDGLWRYTCFEVFMRAKGPEYYEFNFAPSTQWAAYRFSSYRAGKSLPEISAPVIEVDAGPDCYRLRASLQLDDLAGLAGEPHWKLALSALLEDKAGNLSYWSLAHPPGKRDFHHPDGFAYEFSAVS